MSNKDRAVQRSNGWRQAMPDMRERAEVLIAVLDAKGATKDGDVVRRLVHLLDSREANASTEERAAWDEYMAARLGRDGDPADGLGLRSHAQAADEALELRRARFRQ